MPQATQRSAFNQKLKLHLLCLAVLVGGLNGRYAYADDSDAVPLKHRWQMQPNLGVVWGEKPGVPFAQLDMARLSSEDLQTKRQEASRAAYFADLLTEEQRKEALEQIAAHLPPNSFVSSEPMEQMTFVAAAISLTDGKIAEELWQHVVDVPQLRSGVEAALIKNQSAVGQQYWMELLANSNTMLADRLNAISGLAACDPEVVLPVLKDILRTAVSQPVQLAAAKSIGKLARDGMVETATELISDGGSFNEILAALVLQNHAAEASVAMNQLVGSDASTAQRIALKWLTENELTSALKQLEALAQSKDPSVCLAVIDAVRIAKQPGPTNQTALLLGHINPRVRRSYRACLQTLAKETSLRPTVLDIMRAGFNDERPLAVEQAILLATFLRERSQVGALLGLLEHPEPGVFVRAAWALQLLANQPEDMKVIFTFAERQTELLATRTVDKPFSDESTLQLAYLFQALGQNKVKAADPMLRRFIPKQDQKMQPITRAAAIWALGKIWADSSDSKLENALVGRVMDQNPMNPEESIVMYTSAIALANIGNPSVVQRVKSVTGSAPDEVVPACNWCMEQLSKESP